jgi:hypothetical protein
VIMIVAVEKSDQRASINDDAWHGASRSGGRCDRC